VQAYLADTSAWHRSTRVAERWSALIDDDQLALCTPVALEILYSARTRAEYDLIARDLMGLPQLPLDARGEALARQTQAMLAARAQHRGPSPADLLIAAVAEVHDATLLHYDRHFETIARVTGQPVEWLARPGTLN
jgi:predicted nucleic acid-binding protein